MSMTYEQFVIRMASQIPRLKDDFDWVSCTPMIIDYAEQRLYRELDLISNVVRDGSSTLTANSRDFTLPTTLGRFVTVTGVNVVTPSGVSVAAGTLNPLTPVSLDYMDMAWPTQTPAATPSVPTCFAPVTDQSIVVGPAPGLPYGIQVIGTIRPSPLSRANPTTFLTLYLPDLFMAAAMVFASEYSAGTPPPPPQGAPGSWEQHYQTLFASANSEEMRRKWQGPSWSSQPPAPLATPPRG